MRILTNRTWRLFLSCASVGLGALVWNGQASAQGMGNSSGFSGSAFGGGGSGGGSSGGSFGGSAFGSSGGGSSGFGSSSFGSGSSGFGSSSFGSSSSFGGGMNSGSTFSSFSGSGGGSGRNNNSSNSAYPTVGTTNAFASYYMNPLSQGLVSGSTSGGAGGGSSQGEFGMPLYGTNALTTTTNSSSTTASVSSATGTFTPSGSPLIVPYVFSAPSLPTSRQTPVSMAATPLVTEVRQILEQSSALSAKDGIQIGSSGGVIVLRGTVNDEHDLRLAEGLIRLTPGVHDVRNELKIKNTPTGSGG